MPHTIAILIHLADREIHPDADPLEAPKRGDIWQAYVAPLPGSTGLSSHYGYITVSGVPDEIGLSRLRHVITTRDYDHETDGPVRNRHYLNIDIDSLPGGEQNILASTTIPRVLSWNLSQFFNRTDIRGTKNRKVVAADFMDDPDIG